MNLPPYQKFPILVKDTFLLRDIREEDFEDIVGISFYDGKRASSIEDARKMQERINEDYSLGNSIHWGIADLQTNELMGTLGFYRGFRKEIGEIGFVMRDKFQGKGLMLKSLNLVIAFAKKEMHLKKLIAITSSQNKSALKLLKRANFSEKENHAEETLEFEYYIADIP